jgi:hypothetical protein
MVKHYFSPFLQKQAIIFLKKVSILEVQESNELIKGLLIFIAEIS